MPGFEGYGLFVFRDCFMRRTTLLVPVCQLQIFDFEVMLSSGLFGSLYTGLSFCIVFLKFRPLSPILDTVLAS